MELNLYFTGLVLLICAIHLATVVGHSFKQPTQPGFSAATGLHAQLRVRDDWYVFFHCADLLGPDWPANRTQNDERNHTFQPQARPKPGPARMRAAV